MKIGVPVGGQEFYHEKLQIEAATIENIFLSAYSIANTASGKCYYLEFGV